MERVSWPREDGCGPARRLFRHGFPPVPGRGALPITAARARDSRRSPVGRKACAETKAGTERYITREDPTLHATMPAEPSKNARRPLTILVVEDEVLVRLMIADELRQAGFVVLEAVNADEAMVVLSGPEAVDLLFTDVRMPGTRSEEHTSELQSLRHLV